MVVYGRAAVMDSLLTLTLTLGLGAYLLHAVSKPSRLLVVLAFSAFGLSVLSKGPVGLLLPLIIIGAFHACRDRQFVPSRSVLAIAAISFLAVVAPWHIAILRTQGWEFVEVFLIHHNVDRFLTTVHRHPGPLYYYLPVLVVALFPWSAFLPAALIRSTRELDPRRLFLLVWIVTPFVFFSLAGSKLPGYIIPVLPPCALLLGLLWTGRDQAELPRRSLAFHLLLTAALAATAYYTFTSRLPDIGHTGLVLGLLILGLALGVYLRARSSAFWSLVASSLATTLLLVAHVAPQLEPYKSLKTLASRGAAQLRAGERLICYKNFYPQAHFYTQDRLGEIWTLEEFRIRTREWGRILTLVEPPRLHELIDEPSLQLTVIEECGGKVLAEALPVESGSPDG
jgi:4-amino-4-deoxy-L-arabinose transferase-like glycosyltransferase